MTDRKPPDKVFLQWIEGPEFGGLVVDGWSQARVFDSDVEYVLAVPEREARRLLLRLAKYEGAQGVIDHLPTCLFNRDEDDWYCSCGLSGLHNEIIAWAEKEWADVSES